MKKQPTSGHILSSSANLLGICFLVLTSLKVLQLKAGTFIDECTAVATMLFMTACIFSFLAIRNSHAGEKLELVADYFFLAGLTCLCITTLLFTFNFIH